MTIGNKVWPTNKAPIKEEIERMYKCAYYVNPGFFKTSDLVDFGIDFHRLKEFGEVDMKKELGKIRPHVQALWDRMGAAQRTMFLYSYFAQGCNYLEAIIRDMGATLEEKTDAEDLLLKKLIQTVNMKFPVELQEKLNDGFGKEWAK